ncbi:MAG: FG-GAP-like repeat-containing protein [Polyangiales bacterium]
MRRPLRLASSVLALASLHACSKDERPPAASKDAGIVFTDNGVQPVDTGPPVDSGAPPVDSGSDAGTPPPDTGTPPVDGGAPSTGARLLAPFSGSVVRSRRPAFRWTAQPGASAYRVEFSTTRAFTAVESSSMATGTELQPSADLPQGLRWWRVVPVMGSADGSPTVAWPVTLGRARNDLDGDGFADIAIGAPTITTTAPGGQGRVDMFRGPTPANAATSTFSGSVALGQAGAALAMGDLDGDGFADLAVGAPFESSAERVYILRGGSTLPSTAAVTLTPPAAGLFGRSLVIPGDLNGDGYNDLVVGAPSAASGAGRVYVYLGGATLDGTPDLELMFSNSGDQLGRSISGTDVNGDGFMDVIVSAHTSGSTSAGAAYVFLGGATLDPTVDVVLSGSTMSEFFGSAVAGIGDFDGDGYGDFAVSAPPLRSGTAMVGRVAVYMGRAAHTAITAPGWEVMGATVGTVGEEIGRSLAGVGDVNGDGYADLAVGAPANATNGSRAGRAYVFLGGTMPSRTPAVTYANSTGVMDAAGDQLGQGIAGAGDVDGDGFSDVLVYAQNAPLSGNGGPGSVYLYSGAATALSATPRWTAVGTAVVGRYGEGLAMILRRFSGG